MCPSVLAVATARAVPIGDSPLLLRQRKLPLYMGLHVRFTSISSNKLGGA